MAALVEKKEKKERRDFTLLFRLRVSFVFARTRERRDTRDTDIKREREKDGSRTTVVFAGLYAKHAPFVYVKRERKRERSSF